MKNSNRPTTRPADRKQAAAFRKAARELGADKSDERFREVLRIIVKRKPSHLPKQKIR